MLTSRALVWGCPVLGLRVHLPTYLPTYPGVLCCVGDLNASVAPHARYSRRRAGSVHLCHDVMVI